MKRDLDRLAACEHDVLVIGGGIHGAAQAHACARLGMRVALVEQGDFGQATSANSLKILHGGLRYLQHGNLRRMRDSIRARRDLLRLAPHCVKPLPCLIPNYGHGLRGNLAMRCALWLNDLIGADRNRGVTREKQLAPGKIMPRTEAVLLLAGSSGDEPCGASLWHDCLAVNTERLTLALVQAAVDLGGQAANYAEVTAILFADGRAVGAQVRDRESGRQLTVRVRAVVNAAGPWLNQVLAGAGLPAIPASAWAKAVNIVVRKSLWGPHAVGLTGEPEFADQDAVVKKKGRFFFFVPWRGYTMIGTTYQPFAGPPREQLAETADIEELLREVNRIYPAAALTLADVTQVHAGLVPMAGEHGGQGAAVQLVKESEIIDHGEGDSGHRGLLSLRGVKYTTAPRLAQAAAKRLARYLAREYGWRPAPLAQPAAAGATKAGTGGELPPDFRYLAERYGSRAALVEGYVRANARRISQEPPLCLGEVEYFLAEEMARTLADVVCRRCELASAECPSLDILEAIARHMAPLCGWDEERVGEEIRSVLALFSVLPSPSARPGNSRPVRRAENVAQETGAGQ